jgi:hypothetical protein
MEKIQFNNLGLELNDSVKTINFKKYEITIKEYLPIQERLEIIANTINAASTDDTNPFYNPVKVEVFLALEILAHYTNIDFEGVELAPADLYDLVSGSGLLDAVYTNMEMEKYKLHSCVESCIRAIYEYEHSLMGIVEHFNAEYENLDTNAENIQAKLADPNNLALLKEIMSKLG